MTSWPMCIPMARLPLRRRHYPPGSHQLLCHRQRGSGDLPGGSGISGASCWRWWRTSPSSQSATRPPPTLGYTHYQPAQLVTVGKRAALWMQDFLADLEELDFVLGNLKFLGCRGTTGTEASFLDLFDGDGAKIDEMNRQISAEFGFER